MSGLVLRMGAYLRGYSHTGNGPDTNGFSYSQREMLKSTEVYLRDKSLIVISGVGILIAGVGILALLSSMSYLPGLVGFLHAGCIPAHAMMIGGASAIGADGAVTTIHLAMLGSKKYAAHVIS